MKHYYIKYPRKFLNEYSLLSVDAGSEEETELVEHGYWRIPRKVAEHKCWEEKWRRKYDKMHSGYAPVSIVSYADYRKEYEL